MRVEERLRRRDGSDWWAALAIGSNSAANIFGRNTAPLFRAAYYHWRAPDFPEFAFMIPQLAISSGESEREQLWAGQGRFCRFVTLQCINEQTFIRAETVFSAIANCRVALARPSIVHFPPTFPRGGEMMGRFSERLHPWLTPYYRYWVLHQQLAFSVFYYC